jgi:hypothetical protein
VLINACFGWHFEHRARATRDLKRKKPDGSIFSRLSKLTKTLELSISLGNPFSFYGLRLDLSYFGSTCDSQVISDFFLFVFIADNQLVKRNQAITFYMWQSNFIFRWIKHILLIIVVFGQKVISKVMWNRSSLGQQN